MLDHHNMLRIAHQAMPLTICPKARQSKLLFKIPYYQTVPQLQLTKLAQNYAQWLLENDEFSHNEDLPADAGENLAECMAYPESNFKKV